MSEEKEFEVLVDGNEVVAGLVLKYGDDFLWGIDPAKVMVMGVINKKPTKSKRRKLATIRRLDPVTKALLRYFECINILYFIEVNCLDWMSWSEPRRQMILLHELIHIPKPGEESLIPHDVEDFSALVEQFGCDWFNNADLPNLLGEEKVVLNYDKFSSIRKNS